VNEDGGNWHVLPMNDLKPHVERGQWCHCQPEVRKRADGYALVIHNAYDAREFGEVDDDSGE
jgi:hypothetical protein